MLFWTQNINYLKEIICHLFERSTKNSECAFEKDFTYMFIKSLDI